MNIFKMSVDADGIATVVIDTPKRPVNTMDEAYVSEFIALVAELENKRSEISGVILTSAKSTFIAGGDLKYMMAVTNETQDAFVEWLNTIKATLRRLETLGRPVVAAINGSALGGGYETCLSCHHRIALNNPKIQIGVPEAGLGLMPAAGGVSRLIRLLGYEQALPYLLDGTRVAPEQALADGLIDDLAATQEELLEKARAWIRSNPAAQQPWDIPGFALPGGGPNAAAVAELLAGIRESLIKKTRGLYPAPIAILAAAIECGGADIDSAGRIESLYFIDLLMGPVARNMITTLFLQMNEINAGASRPAGFQKSRFTKIGVLGAGMMGAGIAYACAAAGFNVVLRDVSTERAEKGKDYSRGLLGKAIERGRMTAAARDEFLNRIHATGENLELIGCDLIIEAVFEDIDVKAKITREVEPLLATGAVFASNTSTLPISRLAESSAAPENFIGLHFFSPVDRMPLVEIICGRKTSDSTLARAFDFVQSIRKTPIVVNDMRKFYTSRVFSTFLDEGIRLLLDGMDPLEIDKLAMQTGMPVGPLTAADEVSQKLLKDICTQNEVMDKIEGRTEESVVMLPFVTRFIDEFGRSGKAHKKGFYDYDENGKKVLWPRLYELYVKPETRIPVDDVKDRIIFRQSLEAVRCLEQGVLRSVRDCNIGSIMGIGFPQWTGGQLQYINTYGPRRFVQRARELAEQYGVRFEPPALLVQKAENNELFLD